MFVNPLLARELRSGLRPLLIWAAAMVLSVASGMVKFTALSSTGGGGASITDLLSTMPDSLRYLMGFGRLDVATMAGYFGVLFLYLELTLAIHAVLVGSGLLSRHERDHTAEFLYAKPVRRTTVVVIKFAAALVQLVVLNLATLATTLVLIPQYNHGPDITNEVLALFASLGLVQLVLASLGLALAAVLRDPRRAAAWASGFVVVAYLLDRVAPLSSAVAALDVVSPFSWFPVEALALGHPADGLVAALAGGLSVALLALSLWAFPRRDLRV